MPRFALAVEAALGRACPFLVSVAVPSAGMFMRPPPQPSLYPDSTTSPGYYIPYPPAEGTKAARPRAPTLIGSSGGRPWVVRVYPPEHGRYPILPTLEVRSFVRLFWSNLVPFPSTPWISVAMDPGRLGPNTMSRGDPFNSMKRDAFSVIGETGLLLGRAATLEPQPPVAPPLLAEGWTDSARAFVRSPEFLGPFARWQRRADLAAFGSYFTSPTLRIRADRFQLTTGMNPALDPSEHARTFVEMVDAVGALERAVTGRDAREEPLPTVRLEGPPGSIPDLRPSYRCPKCGSPEIVKLAFDRSTGLAGYRTIKCGVELFPPIPSRLGDVIAAAQAALPDA